MALEGSYTDEHGVSHSAAYHVLSRVFCDNLNGTCKMRMEIYADSTARNNGKEPLTVIDPLNEDDADDPSTVYSNNLSPSAGWSASENPFDKAYQYVKGLSRFSGMTDV